jgi:hypothetical protein
MHAPLLALPLLAATLACTAVAAPRAEALPANLPVSASWAETPWAETPLVEDNGRILVRVSIGGQDSLIFILDTAAQGGAISPETRDLLGLDPASAEAVNVRGASGPTTLTRMRLPPVALADETVDGLRAVVMDMARYRRSEGPPYAGILGAPTSTLNWHAAAAMGVTRESPGLAASRSAAGVSGDVVETHRHRIDGIGVEELRFPPLDLPVFQALGFGERPAMLLGADLLRECRVFISYSQRRVHLCGDAAG